MRFLAKTFLKEVVSFYAWSLFRLIAKYNLFNINEARRVLPDKKMRRAQSCTQKRDLLEKNAQNTIMYLKAYTKREKSVKN